MSLIYNGLAVFMIPELETTGFIPTGDEKLCYEHVHMYCDCRFLKSYWN